MKLIMSVVLAMLVYSHLAPAANVVLGQSCVLTGPTAALGTEMQRGAKAYFDGTGITLKTSDDKYEPDLCVNNTKQFIQENVAALFGYVGTPTAKAALPLTNEAKKVFFGAFTGAGFLSDVGANPYAFSVRASYDMETESMVSHLIQDKGIKEIAAFIQDDAFGETGLSGIKKALDKRGLKPVEVGQYKRNTIAIKEGADKVIASKAKAVILIGAYKPCGEAIKYWKKKGFNVPFINISFVGSKTLAEVVAADPDNVYITQVVPDPWDAAIPIVKEYQGKVKSNFEFISLEGYIAAKVLHEAIKKAGEDANNSEKLKSAIESLNMDIGGLKISMDDHRGLSETYLTKIEKGGKFKYIDKL